MDLAADRRGKLVVAALMAGVLALMLVLLQQQFDRGDREKAVKLLLATPEGSSWSIAHELDARAGAAPPQCEPRIASSFAGLIEVSCVAGPGGPYLFSVDLVAKAVRPLEERAAELIRAVEARRSPGQGDAGT